MNNHLGAVCDDFYMNCRLQLRLEIPFEQETFLRFFERIGKTFPEMRKLRHREDGSLLLEEEPDGRNPRKWLRVESSALRFGAFPVTDPSYFFTLAETVLEFAPYYLTLSPINFEYFEVLYGFDLDYRGNHDQLLAETFWGDSPFAGFIMGEKAIHAIECQPYFGISMRPDCDLQAYVEIKSRSSTWEIRTGEYDGSPISVFLTARKYWGFDDPPSLMNAARDISSQLDEIAAEQVVPLMVNPLAQAIAGRT